MSDKDGVELQSLKEEDNKKLEDQDFIQAMEDISGIIPVLPDHYNTGQFMSKFRVMEDVYNAEDWDPILVLKNGVDFLGSFSGVVTIPGIPSAMEGYVKELRNTVEAYLNLLFNCYTDGEFMK